jgi:serine/threonine-protein kinase
MLYELFAGHPPFQGDTPAAIMNQHLRGAIPRLDRENLAVSSQVAAVAARCLQRHPEDRYPTMRALIDALDHPDAVDVSILDKATGAATAVPFWRSQVFVAVMISIGVMAAMVILALALQGVAR